MPGNAIDLSIYNPPGVYTVAGPPPALAVNSSLPTAIGLFGLTIGYESYIESVLINPDTNETTPAVNRTLSKVNINTDTIEVVNPNSGLVYTLNTDYTIVQTGGYEVDHTQLYTIQRVIDGGRILERDTVQLRYQYTDTEYYDPTVMFDFDDIKDKYGAPFDADGNIQSELTLCAQFATLNGANQIVCVAVNPEDPAHPTVGDYRDALEKLEDHELVGIVVPCSGDQPLHQVVQEHVAQQSANRHERRAIVGLDGVASPIASAQRMANAQELTDSRMALISPAAFTYFSPDLNRVITLGGQYMAAAVAGKSISMSYAQPLTRKVIAGFNGVPEQMREGAKTLESRYGLMVVELRRRLMTIRHGVTTDPETLITREWSLTGEADALCYRMRDYLDTNTLIGQPIDDTMMMNVKGAAEAALVSLMRDKLVRSYVGLKVTQLRTNPDVLVVSFGWMPLFPLNYIVVAYSISLTSGTITSSAGTSNSSNVGSITGLSTSSTDIFGLPWNTLTSV